MKKTGTEEQTALAQGMSHRKQIKTFVVFDTETTGLPSPGNNPKITELCFIALTREELQAKQKNPRVLNKLLICFNPLRRISHGSSEITDLHNDALEPLASFKTQASLICTFLKNLPQPACLIAHNGNGFDFPLLVSELQNANEEVPDGILCADSLEAFRMFDGLPPVPEFVLKKKKQADLVKDKVSARVAPGVSGSQMPRDLVAVVYGASAQQVEYGDSGDHEGETDQSGAGSRDTSTLKRSSDCVESTAGNNSKHRKSSLEWDRVESTPRQPTATKSSLEEPPPPPQKSQSHAGDQQQETVFQNNVVDARRQLFEDDGSSAVKHDETHPPRMMPSQFLSNAQTDSERDLLQCVGDAKALHIQRAGGHPVVKDRNGEESSATSALENEAVTDSEREMILLVTEVEKSNTDSGHGIDNQSVGNSSICNTVASDSAKVSPNTTSNIGKSSEKKEKIDVYTRGVNAHKEEVKDRVSYRLSEVYSRVFGQQPHVSHTAEDDCFALLKIMHNKLDVFPAWCEEHAKLLMSIEPMY